MKSIKHLLFATMACLLLAGGLAKAAESFDVVTTNTHVQQVNDADPTGPCIFPPG